MKSHLILNQVYLRSIICCYVYKTIKESTFTLLLLNLTINFNSELLSLLYPILHSDCHTEKCPFYRGIR